MIKDYQNLVRIKKLKYLEMYHNLTDSSVIIVRLDENRDQIAKFIINKNERFPVQRGLISAIQRFYRRKIKLPKKD